MSKGMRAGRRTVVVEGGPVFESAEQELAALIAEQEAKLPPVGMKETKEKDSAPQITSTKNKGADLRMRGRVKRYGPRYGFIETDTGDVYVSYERLEESGLHRLVRGDIIEFRKARCARGWEAVEIRVLKRAS